MKLMSCLTGVVRSSVLLCMVACVLVSAAFMPTAEAGAKRKPKVLYLHADGFNPPLVADVKSKLNATGLFSPVDTFDGGAATPTLAQLNAYDAVMVTNDAAWSSAANLGTALAAYVDGGGGVVQTVFTTGGVGGSNLAGNWTASYNSIVFGLAASGPATLGTIADQNHPIMIGVQTFDGGSGSFRPAGTALTAGATLVASWSDGKPLVAVGPKINRCDLGFYPASSDVQSNLWVSSTDGVKLMANALLYVMRPRVLIIHCISAAAGADIASKVKGTNLFSVVDVFDGAAGTPTLTQLQGYDAALVANQNSWSNRTALGNVLADFVDAGGGVVQTIFTTAGIPNSNLGGRWTGTYDIIPFGASTNFSAATLGAVTYANHPIMTGVASFDGGAGSFRPTSTAVNSGGLIVAKWSDGKTLASVSTKYPNRVDLGFFAVSSAAFANSWNPATDGAKLMANSLLYTIKPYVACANADFTNSADVVAKLTASRRFSGVDNINASAATPALSALSPYNAVATWMNSSYANTTTMGNTLADYVDAGGGVVTAMFANMSAGPPAGRWITQGYEITPSPLPGFLGFPATQAFLGTILEPTHPIASFVRKFDGGTNSFRQNATPLLRGRTIMSWTDGKMLTSVHNFKKRADLGYWPVSNNSTNGWNQRTDGTWMTANALEFVVRVKPCPGDFNGDGQVDDNDFVLFAAYYDALVDPRGDLTGDGNTEDSDFVIFANSYDTLTCP